MIALIVGFFEGIINLLKGILPQSPFQDITVSEDIDLALGWLNWILPVDNCLRWFTAWLIALLAFATAKWVIGRFKSFAGGLIGGGDS